MIAISSVVLTFFPTLIPLLRKFRRKHNKILYSNDVSKKLVNDLIVSYATLFFNFVVFFFCKFKFFLWILLTHVHISHITSSYIYVYNILDVYGICLCINMISITFRKRSKQQHHHNNKNNITSSHSQCVHIWHFLIKDMLSSYANL